MSADVKEMAVCVKENSTTREWKKKRENHNGMGTRKRYICNYTKSLFVESGGMLFSIFEIDI